MDSSLEALRLSNQGTFPVSSLPMASMNRRKEQGEAVHHPSPTSARWEEFSTDKRKKMVTQGKPGIQWEDYALGKR